MVKAATGENSIEQELLRSTKAGRIGRWNDQVWMLVVMKMRRRLTDSPYEPGKALWILNSLDTL